MPRWLSPRLYLAWGGAILIACYFLSFTWRGLDSYFSRDDLMNVQSLHGYWEIPLWRLCADTFLVWLPSYRPFGGVVYRFLFLGAGMNPVPFHVFCFLLLFTNIALVYQVARILTDSAEMAFLAALIFCYHPALFDLYYDSATLYDLLCGAFYFTIICVYVKWRRSNGSFSWIQVLILLTLLLLALQSKEMALTLPVILTAYEIFYPRRSLNRCLILMYILTAAVLTSKLLTKNALSANPLYHPQFSLDLVGHAYAHYYRLLFPALPLSAALALVIAGLIWRAKLLWFGLLFFVVALVPVVVVPPRAGFVMYIPMLGLALAAAFLMVAARDAAVSYLRISSKLQPQFCVAMAAALLVVYSNYRTDALRPLLTDQENLRAAASDLPRLRGTLRPGANVLLVNDPMSPESWECTWLFRLLYADPRIWVDRRRDLANADAAELSLYDHAFENRSGQYVEVALPPPASLAPVKVIFTPSRVRQGEAYAVSMEEFPDSAVDVAFWLVKDSPISGGVVRNWCSLDKNGSARLIAPADAPAGTIVLKKVRPAGAVWRPAEGSLEVVRR
ncbi:MAG: hypothetical protein HYX25_06705 [Candidatus Solibacter usitatus]|nr:hypothetical protein [Candidatus Solibacter usitatus]